MLLTTAFLLAAVGLELQAKPLQEEILVGEPLKLQVTWLAPKRVEVWPEAVRLVVTAPGYREVIAGEVQIEPVRLATPVGPGQPLVTTMPILHRGDYFRDRSGRSPLMFPAPGEYTIQVAYDRMQAASKPVVVRVVAPEGEEAEVFGALYENGASSYDERRAAALLAKHPRSRYLRMASLGEITNRLAGIDSARELGQPVMNMSPEERREWHARHAHAALQELESRDWGGWEEDRLVLAIDIAKAAGDKQTAERLEEDVLRRLPDSAKAQEIKRRRARAAASDDEDDKESPLKPSPKPKQ